MKYFFPIHLDGDNRGCEGIAKGTAILLGEPKDNLIGLCRNIKLDIRLGIDRYVKLISPVKPAFLDRVINKICKCMCVSYRKPYPVSNKIFLSEMRKEDVLISTGGDMMCYGNNQVISTNDQAIAQGCKTILWGCSMGPENLTPEKETTLRKFSLIYARESLSYDFFKSLGLKNVVCLPDPAFVLEPESCQLPDCFHNSKVIGINLSNYTVGADNLDTPFGVEVKELINYIIKESDYHLLLIPHVMWDMQDDRLISQFMKNEYPEQSDRISILKSETLNYLQIRYVISHCHMFIGGRTHAMISAYSTCVPAIALGYSIKSKGIAKDLGLPEKLVVDTKHPVKGALLDAFKYTDNNYLEIKTLLSDIMPSYRKKAFEIRTTLKHIS